MAKPVASPNAAESTISFDPTVNHHRMKNGLSALRAMPTINGPLLPAILDVSCLRFSLIILAICKPAKASIAIPPISPTTLAYFFAVSNVNSPAASMIIRGSSTAVWP